MLSQCRRRLAREKRRVRLVHADAHALPFPDAFFDRVFHVGGIATYRDTARALAEMARVARPRTPIVVVDEQLDARGSHSLLRRLAFSAITFYDPAPHAPRECLPPTACDVLEEQVSAFYYCLRFRTDSAAGP
jgi:ubiquinone/menaquinone biosynthesis C-methylase UbiE